MGERLQMAKGTTGTWIIGLADDQGAPIALPDDPGLDAIVWRGDDEAPLFEPIAAVADAGAGEVRLAILANQVAAMEPAEYRLQVGVTVEGARTLGFDGVLELTGAPGAGEAPRVLASADDLYRFYGTADLLESLDHERSGFLEARAEARAQVERRLLDGYRPRPGFVRRRGPIFDPICGFDRPDPATPPPARDQLRAWLAGPELVADEGLRRIASLLAASIVFQRQETNGDNTYRAEADRLRGVVDGELRRLTYALATGTDVPGEPTVEVAPGSIVTFLQPAGGG